MATTVQNIVDAVSQDIRKQLASTALSADAAILIDYTNRVNLAVLRASRWKFLQSAPQFFITEKEQTDYYIGNGSLPAGQVQTGLSLSDFDIIKEDSVYDRSNFRQLLRTSDPPLVGKLSLKDSRYRPSKPAVFRCAPDTPNTINIYPAPDNQNSYQMVPYAPYLTYTAGGALARRTYYVRVTFVDSNGNESSGSDEATIVIPANNVLVVHAPQVPITPLADNTGVALYNVYVGTTVNGEVLQASNQATSADWTEPNGGLIGGTQYPTANALEQMTGYLIEFRYYKARAQLTTAGQSIQVPDNYKDVVIAGVDALAFQYLKSPAEAQLWAGVFQAGVRSIIRDANLFPKGDQFIRPDSAAIGQQLPAVESFDTTLLGSNG